ncbi:hypothetical protein C8R44DRAFT_882978 [Mycena epipterygia]|nr:hypothetical protein C8R44DRAFT_882978 [Mycena epipterygia]
MSSIFARKEYMLRSRSRSFGSPPEPSQTEELEAPATLDKPTPPGSFGFGPFRKVSDIYKFFLLSFILLAAVFPIKIWHTTSRVLPTATIHPREHPSQDNFRSPLAAISSRPPKVPLVDRAILQKLADMETSPDPDERPYFASSHRWPPMVTQIPEARKPVIPPPDICGPEPCRFLLPLRISEQESKARSHFMEIVQLAQKLDRILVLPNVGKSRMGSCFKSDFKMYYDLERLTDDLPMSSGRAATVKLDLFRRWAIAEAPTSQFLFLAPKEDPQSKADLETFSNEDVSIRVGDTSYSGLDLPGCFATKFHGLRLDTHAPLYVHLKPESHRRPIDASILDALARHEIQAAAAVAPSPSPPTDPAVLVLTWDLRHPIFPVTLASARLHYAPRIHALARALVPLGPYVMVHWRMESVAPAALPQCAHALVDTLAHLPGGVRTVWFASDYPHAVHRSARPGMDYGTAASSAARKAKSGTFRDVGPLHAEAVGIVGDAFAEGGELEGWEVAELTDARLAGLEGDWEPELLDDAGVRAIVDKIIGTQAMLFVSGAPGCARSSSFTRQVLDERREALVRTSSDVLPTLHNVVEFFG